MTAHAKQTAAALAVRVALAGMTADAKQTALAKEETRKEWKEEKEEEEESEFKDFRIQGTGIFHQF